MLLVKILLFVLVVNLIVHKIRKKKHKVDPVNVRGKALYRLRGKFVK